MQLIITTKQGIKGDKDAHFLFNPQLEQVLISLLKVL